MRRLLPIKLLALSCLLAACVTVNVYFPAAAAEQAAGQMFISSRPRGSFTVTHRNNAQIDRTFSFECTGSGAA